ncbi:protein of unknown function [Methylorubrum extorquens]|uniref:Uncharacterized protein n=1 Tax=Methylorubrum extorquens TaxID=408 RepID=A0A2N9AR70_METEX|nr:protein of unknown function [Methylorubrum extorquens]
MSRDPRAFAAELRADAQQLRTMAGDLDARADGLCALAEQQERDAVSRERAKRAAIAASLEAEGRTFHRSPTASGPGPTIWGSARYEDAGQISP